MTSCNELKRKVTIEESLKAGYMKQTIGREAKVTSESGYYGHSRVFPSSNDKKSSKLFRTAAKM